MKIKLLLLFILTINYNMSNGQCSPDAFATDCVPKLGAGLNFLKSYKVDGNGKDKVEYSYVFTKGTQYMINLCTAANSADGIVVSILDKDRNKVASNKIGNQLASGIAYACNATGIYYIQYTFDQPSARCGGSALGFKR